MAPTFSVVIPLYNSQLYIEETLHSLVHQTSDDWEAIVVDDGSTDRSVAVVNEFIEKNGCRNIKLYTNRPAKYLKGVSGARNYGVEVATGEWICFLDSDDLFHPQKIELLLKVLNEDKGEAGAIYHAPRDFYDGVEKVSFDHLYKGELEFKVDDISEQLSLCNIIYTSCTSVKRSNILNAGSFDYELNGVEDYYLWLNISKSTKWAYLTYPLTAYRVRQNSLMGGRRMSYYIGQDYSLVKKVNRNELFSTQERKNVEDYFMNKIMDYYAMISIDKYGWSDFISGLLKLTVLGYGNVSVRLFIKHFRFKLLNCYSRLRNR